MWLMVWDDLFLFFFYCCEFVCVCVPVCVRSFVRCLFMPESTLRSPVQETDLSGKKDRAHGNEKKKKKKKKFTHEQASTGWHWYCRSLSQAASFIKAEHKTGRTLTPWPQLCQPRLQKWQRAVRPGHLHLHKMFVFHHLWTVLGIFSEASRIVNIRGIQQSAVLSCVFS